MSVFEFNRMLRIFVEFPIYRYDKTFTVYEVLPLPTKIKNSDLFYSIIPETQYFAMSINFEYYYDLSVADLQEYVQNTSYQLKHSAKSQFQKLSLLSLHTGKSFNIENIFAQLKLSRILIQFSIDPPVPMTISIILQVLLQFTLLVIITKIKVQFLIF
jgi:hypothetical protein